MHSKTLEKATFIVTYSTLWLTEKEDNKSYITGIQYVVPTIIKLLNNDYHIKSITAIFENTFTIEEWEMFISLGKLDVRKKQKQTTNQFDGGL